MNAAAHHATAADSAAVARSKRLRTVAWAALPVMALVYYALLTSGLPPFTRLVALELVYCTPIVLTVTWSLRARALSEGRESTFWATMAGANFTLLMCEVLLVWWVAFVSPAGPPRVCWPFHILHGIAAAFFIVGLLSLSRWIDAPTATRVRWMIDMSSTLVVAMAVIVSLYVLPIMAPAGATMPEVLLGAAYPLFGLLMILGTAANITGFKFDRWRPWDKLFTVSLTIYAAAISLWPIWYPTAVQTSRNYERGILDLVQFSGHWLLMAAAVYRLTEVTQWRLASLPPLQTRRRWTTAISPAIALLGLPIVGVFAIRSYAEPEWFLFYVGMVVVLAMLTVGRSILIALENGAFSHLSTTDALTGLANRRFLIDRLGDEITRSERYGDALSLIVVDLDDFSGYNARQGFSEGEQLLRQVATLLNGKCARTCTIARLDADDFAIVMPETTVMDATVFARRLLDSIGIEAGIEPGTVTACAGVASYPLHAESPGELLEVAQAALYQAKQDGRERIVAYDDDRVPDLNVHDKIERLERQSRMSSAQALVAAIEARDPEAHQHALVVSDLSCAVARSLELSGEALDRTCLAALLHEVGSIGSSSVPSSMARRAGERDASSSSEQLVFAQRILGASGLTDLTPIVRSRHERWDGSGEPDGLAGDEIPFEARILAACDYYETAIVDRPHQRALSHREARGELLARSGTRFDPAVVTALIGVLDGGLPAIAG